MLGLALCRYILGRPGAVALDHEAVVAWLGPTLHRYLTALAPAASAEPGPLPLRQ